MTKAFYFLYFDRVEGAYGNKNRKGFIDQKKKEKEKRLWTD